MTEIQDPKHNPFQNSGTQKRILTDNELEKLHKDTMLVTEFKQQKLETEAQKNWDLFYKRNTTKFFKDRHWTKREFEELSATKSSTGPLVLFEAGCGVGNFLFPLLDEDVDKQLFIYACDFSPRAVNFVKENPLFNEQQSHIFQCDLTKDDITKNIPSNSVDIATMIFVLSAIHPDKMAVTLQQIYKVLKPGGLLLFRDYGLYDHAMLRFNPGHKLGEQFYVRQDNTRAYYFTLEEIDRIMNSAGLQVTNCEYVHRETVNHKEKLSVQRVFVQAKCLKSDFITENG